MSKKKCWENKCQESYYIPTLTYGEEIWTWMKAYINRRMAAEMKLLRSAEGKAKRKGLRSEEILEIKHPGRQIK
jgi:hypothetical protein